MKSRPLILARLALRNLRREVRRSALTAAAMVVGLGLMVLSRTLAAGAHEDWIHAGVSLGSGHVTVQATGYDDSGDLDRRLPGEILPRISKLLDEDRLVELVTAVTARIEVDGLASSATNALPIRIVAVDPETEGGFSKLARDVAEGRYLDKDDRLHAFIGAELAKRLDVGLGRRLVLTAQDASGEILGQLVRVVGIFRSGIEELDQGLVHIPLRTAGAWLGVNDDVTRIALLVKSSSKVSEVTSTLREELGSIGEMEVLSWREAMPELDAAVRIDDWGDYIFHGILLSIVAIAIVNTILMSVLYRQREFGVLRALGLTQTETGLIVFGEGVALTALSGLLGMALGLAVTWVFFRNGLDFSFLMEEEMTFSGVLVEPVIVPQFNMGQVGRSVLYVAIIGTLSSMYPAYFATRIDVASAVKVEQ